MAMETSEGWHLGTLMGLGDGSYCVTSAWMRIIKEVLNVAQRMNSLLITRIHIQATFAFNI
jgi:hypothetical protein